LRKVLGSSSPIRLHCDKCQTEWITTFPLPMELGAFCHMLGGLVCPQCGATTRAIKLLTRKNGE
jgi:hypothetical protein